MSNQTSWGTARMEVKPDLTAGKGSFGWKQRKEWDRRENMNAGTSILPHSLGTWVLLISPQEARIFSKVGLPQPQL